MEKKESCMILSGITQIIDSLEAAFPLGRKGLDDEFTGWRPPVDSCWDELHPSTQADHTTFGLGNLVKNISAQ